MKNTRTKRIYREPQKINSDVVYNVFQRKANSYIIPYELENENFQLFLRHMENQWCEIAISIVIPPQTQYTGVQFHSLFPNCEKQPEMLDRVTFDVFREATTVTCRKKCKTENIKSAISSCCDAILDVLESIRNISRKESVELEK